MVLSILLPILLLLYNPCVIIQYIIPVCNILYIPMCISNVLQVGISNITPYSKHMDK